MSEEVTLNEETCPLMRDTKNFYKVLERLFATLTQGMAFGELALSLTNTEI